MARSGSGGTLAQQDAWSLYGAYSSRPLYKRAEGLLVAWVLAALCTAIITSIAAAGAPAGMLLPAAAAAAAATPCAAVVAG